MVGPVTRWDTESVRRADLRTDSVFEERSVDRRGLEDVEAPLRLRVGCAEAALLFPTLPRRMWWLFNAR